MARYDFPPRNTSPKNGTPWKRRGLPWFCFALCREKHVRALEEPDLVVKETLGDAYSSTRADERNRYGDPVVNIVVSRDRMPVGILTHLPAVLGSTPDFLKTAARNPYWPNGPKKVAKCKSVVIAMVAPAQNLAPVPAAMLLTRLALVALKVFDGFGVYWPWAHLCNSRKFFEKQATTMTDERLAVPLWIRCNLTRNPDNTLAAHTRGMERFGLPDLEVDRCLFKKKTLRLCLCLLANTLLVSDCITHRYVLVRGETKQDIRLRLGLSRSKPWRRVYKVSFK